MRIILTIIGLLTGLASIMALWLFNPVIALLCIPMVASVLTALALMFALPVRHRRHRIR
jgi:hypothetical protein